MQVRIMLNFRFLTIISLLTVCAFASSVAAYKEKEIRIVVYADRYEFNAIDYFSADELILDIKESEFDIVRVTQHACTDNSTFREFIERLNKAGISKLRIAKFACICSKA